MRDLRTALSAEQIANLRRAYDADQMTSAMATAVSSPYPGLAQWNDAIEATFYGSGQPLAPIDRERCLIAILTLAGARLSLAIHVYWGLMEGLALDELCHVIGLAACYGGVPRLAHGLPVVDQVATVLARCLERGKIGSADVLTAFLKEPFGS